MTVRKQARSSTFRRLTFVAATVVFLPACGALDFLTGGDGFVDGVGRLPGGDFDTIVTLPPGVEISFPDLNGDVIGPQVRGPRVLMIGDSILASTSSRYGNEMCDVLVPLGWQVEIEAEASRFAEFGVTVLKQQLDAGWDSALVFLGTNFDGNIEAYERNMRRMFDLLTPRPFVVVTTSLFRSSQRDVNEVIRSLADEYEHVTLLDWEEISKNRGVLSDDHVHLSPDGREVFAAAVARSFGFAPPATGACLPSKFRDDSAGAGVMPSTTVDPASSDTTVVPDPETSTTMSPGTTVSPGTEASTTTTPVVTVPLTTTLP
ncbi:MAG: hypothetical protein AAB327_01500 [Actinomycetota bacterium]|mgnify:CR=1 FL=1